MMDHLHAKFEPKISKQKIWNWKKEDDNFFALEFKECDQEKKKKRKKERKHALDQENDKKTTTVKKKRKKHALDQGSDQEKKKNCLSLFLTFLFFL